MNSSFWNLLGMRTISKNSNPQNKTLNLLLCQTIKTRSWIDCFWYCKEEISSIICITNLLKVSHGISTMKILPSSLVCSHSVISKLLQETAKHFQALPEFSRLEEPGNIQTREATLMKQPYLINFHGEWGTDTRTQLEWLGIFS